MIVILCDHIGDRVTTRFHKQLNYSLDLNYILSVVFLLSMLVPNTVRYLGKKR